jgi:hypothetical protein
MNLINDLWREYAARNVHKDTSTEEYDYIKHTFYIGAGCLFRYVHATSKPLLDGHLLCVKVNTFKEIQSEVDAYLACNADKQSNLSRG